MNASSPRLLPVFLFLALGCGGTGVLRSYSDPQAEGRQLEKIAVLAFSPDPEVKARFETVFAEYLRERGNDAVEAHALRPEADTDREPTRDDLKQLVNEEALDGVFTVRVLAEDPNQPGETEKRAYRPDRDGDLYEYFFRTWRDVLRSDPAPPQGLVYLESRLYGTHDAKVVWGGMTVSDDVEDLDTFTRRFADAAVFEMAAKGYVK